MERLTTRHNGVAVIKDKSKHKEAMEKLARYEETEENGCKGCEYRKHLKKLFPCVDCVRNKLDRYTPEMEKSSD